MVAIFNFPVSGNAQHKANKKQYSKNTTLTRNAAFPGGQAALSKYLLNHLQYPVQAREDGIQGRVFLSFIVTEEGKIEDIRIIRDLVAGCGEEALRVVKQMPLWDPALQNGKPIRTLFVLPVVFRINK